MFNILKIRLTTLDQIVQFIYNTILAVLTNQATDVNHFRLVSALTVLNKRVQIASCSKLN